MAVLFALPAAYGIEIPETLPRPDGQPADLSQPVQVYILLGQSNMLGAGNINPGKGGAEGSLTNAVKEKSLYPYLIDDAGNWTVRQDVRNVRVMGSGTGGTKVFNNEWMTISGGKIGPEFGIGHVLGYATEAPVMILKSCIGNRSLGWDLLPPGSPSFEFEDKGKTWHYAAYKESPLRWETGSTPEPIGWYAGMQYDGDIARAKQVLAELDKYYPGAKKSEADASKAATIEKQIQEKVEFATRARFTEEGLKKHNAELAALRADLAKAQAAANGYEVAGFFFWQGDKDRYDAGHASRYEQNLVHLIKQLRVEFGAPNAKFVCATLGQTEKGAEGNEGLILNAQLAVDGTTGKYPEFKGNVATVYTNPLSKGGASNSHYNGNAETYMNVGEAMGRAMAELLGGGDGIKRAYVERANLTEEQEQVVIELAQKQGIEQVAKISTYFLLPSDQRGIAVEGVEQVEGREVSAKVLSVHFKDWLSAGPEPRPGDQRIGDFWAGQPIVKRQTILKVGNIEYRANGAQGLSYQECESLLERLLAGKYTIGGQVNKDQLERIDWNQPKMFRKQGNLVSASFGHKQEVGGFFELEMNQTDQELSIQQILEAIP
ncbi:MAG: sialate O-acetylesterase [Planctomycetaceae bacterium]